jgi:hypothetical protein
MRTWTLFIPLLLPCTLPAGEWDKPDKISIHTWVREDLFAGWMAKDDATFARGVQKLQHYLAANPSDHNALAWTYFQAAYNLRKAATAGDMAAYAKLRAESRKIREKTFASDPKDVGAWIIVGSSLIMGAYYAPEEDKQWMYSEGRELLRKVPVLQAKFFDTLPPHMRGELWSQMIYASDRIGDRAERDRLTTLMLTQLAGSPYESRARRWQKLPEIKSEIDNMCISCHEPGRLAPTLARLQAQKP